MRRTLAASAAASVLALVAATSVHASTNDPFFARQWGLTKIDAERAWSVTDGTGATIAIVDSGVDLDHPDLAANVLGPADADFTGDADSDGAQDENGHGTHVAGIAAAARGNGVGVAGVAPGASILPVRVLDEEGSGSASAVANGIHYAADAGADVINLSLGATAGLGQAGQLLGDFDLVYDAVEYAWTNGAVVVVAAGNDSFPLCSEPSNAPTALCVGATDVNDLRSYFSNSDATMTRPYVVAPGGDGLTCSGEIFSTYLRTAPKTACSPSDGYDAIAGTSMATPFVSGVAALLASRGLTNAQIVDCLLETADDLGTPGRDPVFGYGRVNARAAVTRC
jgi:subtilisin family serine protease